MKRSLIQSLSLMLVCMMLLGALAACKPNEESSTSDTTSGTESEGTTETSDQGGTDSIDSSSDESRSDSETESDTETDTGTETGDASLSGEHADIIEHAHNLANGVTSYFTDASRKYHSIQNQEMTMTYARSVESKQRVTSIKNTQGKSYIEDTMDIFIRMKGGAEFYSSESPTDTTVNIFRFGYYYYQGFYSGQTFVPKNLNDIMENVDKLDLKHGFKKSSSVKLTLGDTLKGEIVDDSDPKFTSDGMSYQLSTYNVMSITMKAVGNTSKMQFYFLLGGDYKENQSKTINLYTDGEYHTYTIPLFDLSSEPDAIIKQIRLDPNGKVGDGFEIKEIAMGSGNFTSYPQYVKINRQFHVYSDKMHHEIQVNVSQTTTDVDAIGVRTEIAKDTVDKLLIVDKNGKTYTSLDGIDWTTVTAVAFDIKEAGIYGYIMPYDGKGGVIKVSEEDGKYVITREIAPPDNTLVPSLAGSRNKDDFYTGCRVYTDENHDFEEFLYENMCEQNPLVLGKNIKVSNAQSDSGEFAGYDSLRGIYVFNVGSPAGHFWTPYNNPNKNYKVNFTISTEDVDRDIYIMSSATNGLLECAAFMDDKLMMLPMPIEVIKNFIDSKNNFNIDDYKFSEAILPLSLNVGERKEYNIINLYQLWGQFPLKQISQIPFHLPYYHLSTGVTETNCITPWYLTMSTPKNRDNLSTLPDHRAWSAPMWASEPQHTNSGEHHWLEYTNSDGEFIAVENVYNTITSFGPTYAEVVMDHISDDGKMKVTYTHMEMPQTDENRAYYTMEYTVLEDITINDFKKNFQFFSLEPNDSTGEYQKISYLDKDNKSAYVDANKDDSKELEYKLGNKNPYFTFYEMPGAYDEKTNPEGYSIGTGYSNLSFIVFNSDFTIEGKDYEPQYVIINSKHKVRLTLDIGDITLKAGDKFTINAIVMPWGSQNSVYDGSNGLAPDQNVIDVRENTCLDPLTVKSESDEIIESTFVPKVKSKDGKSAEFTLSGCKTSNKDRTNGKNAVTVRVYGFDMLTAPKIEEFVDGKWVEYDVSSKNTPDENGYYHYYDGYCVYYDGDGTYSYSFVVDMTEGKERKFRLKADTRFEGWPAEVTPEEGDDPIKVYYDAKELKQIFKNADITLADDLSYFTAKVAVGKDEMYANIHNGVEGTIESGQYLVIKYRIPTENKEKIDKFEFYLSTVNTGAVEGDNISFEPVLDGEWHVAVLDVASYTSHKTFKPASDVYYTKYIRFDMFNQKYSDANTSVDIGFVGMDSDLMTICMLNAEDFETITLYENGATCEVETLTGNKKEPEKIVLIDPSSGYTQSEGLTYKATIDTISGFLVQSTSHSTHGAVRILTDMTTDAKLQAVFAGWCVLEGGIEKFVWSVDGGKTWNDFAGNDTLTNTGADVMNAVGEPLKSMENAGVNGRFQENGNLVADLSAYEGQKVDFIFAAIPAKDTTTLLPLYFLDDLFCSATQENDKEDDKEENTESPFDTDSVYKHSSLGYGAYIDMINGVANINASSGDRSGVLNYTKEIRASEYFIINVSGWAAVDGGVAKYVWTADKGKTWNDCGGTPTNSYDAIIANAKSKASAFKYDDVAAKKNGCFQNADGALEIDLIDYENSTEPLEIWLCAVNEVDQTQATLLFKFTNVTLVASEENQ